MEKGNVSVEYLVRYGISGPHVSHAELSVHHRKEGRNIEGIRNGVGLGKNGFLDMTGSLHSWTDSSCGSLHKICTRSSQSALQHG